MLEQVAVEPADLRRGIDGLAQVYVATVHRGVADAGSNAGAWFHPSAEIRRDGSACDDADTERRHQRSRT